MMIFCKVLNLWEIRYDSVKRMKRDEKQATNTCDSFAMVKDFRASGNQRRETKRMIVIKKLNAKSVRIRLDEVIAYSLTC